MASPQTLEFMRQHRALRRSDPLHASSSSCQRDNANVPVEVRASVVVVHSHQQQQQRLGQSSDSVCQSPAERQFRSTMTDCITVQCGANGHEFRVPRDVAAHSGCIQRMLESGFRESVDGVIRLPSIEPELLEKVFRFCFEDHLQNRQARARRVRRQLFVNDNVATDASSPAPQQPQPQPQPQPQQHRLFASSAAVAIPSSSPPSRGHNSLVESMSPLSPSPTSTAPSLFSLHSPPPAYPPLTLHSVARSPPVAPLKKASFLDDRVVFCFDLSSDNVLDVVMAAHYLDVPELLDTACRYVAHHIDAVSSLNGLPREVVECIYSHLRPEQLCEAEATGKYTDVPPFDSANLWRSAFEHHKQWDVSEVLYDAAWTHAEQCELLPLEWAAAGDDADLPGTASTTAPSWKELYLQRDLQNRLDSLRSGADMDALLTHISHCASHIRVLRVPSALTDSVHVSTIVLSEFVSLFAHLRVLDLSAVAQPAEQAVRVLATLHACHADSNVAASLRVLRISGALLSDTQLDAICEQLAHPRCVLRSLDVSNNALTSRSFITLARLLDSQRGAARTLGALSVSENRLHCRDVSATTAFARFLCTVSARNGLRLLDLSRNELSLHALAALPAVYVDVLEALGDNTALEVLLLAENPLGGDMPASTFSDFIVHRPQSLRLLSLRNCGIDTPHAHVLATLLSSDGGALRSLDLSENTLGRDAAPHLAALLERNTSLTSLNLRENRFWDAGGNALAPALAHNRTLRRLDLSNNHLRSATQVIAQIVKRALPESSLVWLNLDINSIPAPLFYAIKEMFNGTRLQLVLQIGW